MKPVKKLIFLWALGLGLGALNSLFTTGGVSFAQPINLVPNPSFEDTFGCPNGYPDLDGKCKDWKSFRITPDYMNNCSSVCGYYNQYGFQQPHIGNSYAGILEYQLTIPNAREHIGVQLITPLIIGTKYYLSFFVSAAYNYSYTNIACNKIGALVTTYQYSDPNGINTLPNTCTIKTDSIIKDTLNWYQIFGSFIADSVYQYLVLGNWFDDNNIDTFLFPYQVVSQASYYYIDDVCLSTDSIYTLTWTYVSEQTFNQNIIEIFPNPSSSDIYITSKSLIQKIEIMNSLGELVFISENQNKAEFKISVKFLQSCLYWLRLETMDGFYYSKIIISY